MKIAICDKIGLCYDGNTLSKRGLGGSESAVILMSKELNKLGFDVTVFNNCIDGTNSSEGVYDGVRYIDNTNVNNIDEVFDIVIVSRTAEPFLFTERYPFIEKAKLKILWLHDTFCEKDEHVQNLLLSNKIDYLFTLSDFHTNYILNCNHGQRRNFEVLKHKVFQTRNGAVKYIDEVDLTKKDKNHFVYNSSATKGLVPLVEDVWPKIKKHIPNAKLTVIGGYYRFRENAKPDEQEKTIKNLINDEKLKELDITFTDVIPQPKIAEILANATFMLYPGAFPETFGISSLESLLYNTPIITTKFGALEETAISDACYTIDFAIEPNSLFPYINKEKQIEKFVKLVIDAYNDSYILQQKQNYCSVIDDIYGWDAVALEWKRFLYNKVGLFLPLEEYRVSRLITQKVNRVFGRTTNMPNYKEYISFNSQQAILIISPFYNAQNYVKQCIQSVAQQDYENYKHILIDDNSTDNSYEIAKSTIEALDPELRSKFILLKNKQNNGAVYNQINAIKKYGSDDDIVMLLDGDDWLINNNTVFHLYNDYYHHGTEFTYGSCWSLVDSIPLIAQDYPESIKKNKSYREHKFNWNMPYTHLRTFKKSLLNDIPESEFKDSDGNWYRAGGDGSVFYSLIEKANPENIVAIKEVIYVYNDANPLNDYKINGKKQNETAEKILNKNKEKTILIAIPTAKYIEPETYKSIYDLEVPDGYKTEFQYFFGYTISQVRNLISEWAKRYDYLLSVDSDIVLPKDTLTKFLKADKDIISGLYIQRIPNTHTLEIYMDTPNGGQKNIPYDLVKNRGIVEVAGCGMGCALIKSKVFQTIPYPHFEYHSALNHKNTISEDIDFCMKARKKGFKIWADSSVICDHIGNTKFIVDK
jgi:glycosyltransferase involved in cell wall biosynthesis